MFMELSLLRARHQAAHQGMVEDKTEWSGALGSLVTRWTETPGVQEGSGETSREVVISIQA